MPTGGKSTLTQFLIEERRRMPEASGDLNALVTSVSLACKAISRRVAYGALNARSASATFPEASDVPTQPGRSLPALSHGMFLRANEWGGHTAGMLSEAEAEPCVIPQQFPRGKYLLMFNPLDGAANADINVTVGSIFSIIHAARPGEQAEAADFLQPGAGQVCAGYAVYGPSTMLVLTMGHGTHAFTLDPLLGEWVLSHASLRIPAQTREFAVDAANSRFWEPAVKRYVDECLAGLPGARGADFSMRWIASLVAETHRILMCGGVFLHPRVSDDATGMGRVRLLYEANPVAYLVEQACGRASNGRSRLLDIRPRALHESVGMVFGSSEEVDRIERYHRDELLGSFSSPLSSPLFARRGLFANAA